MLPKARVLFDDIDHAEDVCCLVDGRMAFGGERGQLYVGNPSTGDVSKVAACGGRNLGLALIDEDALIVCNPGLKAVLRVGLAEHSVLNISSGSSDRPMLHPNSVALGPQGAAFVSDSGRWGKADGAVFAVWADGSTSVASRQSREFPNGLAVDARGSYLYIAESTYGVARCPIEGDSLGPREEVLPLPGYVPDGLTFCDDGSLLISCYQPNAILHLTVRGELEVLAEDSTGSILAMPTNVAFIGPDYTELAVANLGARTIVELSTGLAGAPVAYTTWLPANAEEQ